MNISINKDHMKRMAEELGFEIEFNSEKPGVMDIETGIVHNFMDYFSDFFEMDESENIVTIEKLPGVNVSKPIPLKISMSPNKFSFSFGDNDFEDCVA